jgi:hypothetical protein
MSFGFGCRGHGQRCAVIATCLGALVLGCATTNAPAVHVEGDAQTSAPHVGPSAARREDAAAASSFASSARNVSEWAARERQELARIRGYRGPLEVSYRWVAPSEWPALLAAEIEQLSPESVSRESDAALSTLGLIPSGYDSRAAILQQSLGELR